VDGSKKVGPMRGDMTQQVLQVVYELFYSSGGTWPALGDLQRTLNRQGNGGVDAVWIVQRIPATLLKPLSSCEGYPAPTEKVILTAEGIERCAGSAEDVTNFVIAVRWLARLAERPDSGGYGEPGIRFTTHQLAEAVSLSPESDPNAVSRLVAFLLAEGWVQGDGGTRVSRGQVLYARWEIRAFRGIERFSGYKKIKTRMRPVMDNAVDTHVLRGGKRGWRSLLSDKGLATIIAIGTVVLVLLAVATLIVILL
jgi:hypothetical protein